MSFTDDILTCRDCGEKFTWTTGEQEFYAKTGLQNPPARCNPCRVARKAAQDERAANGGGFGRPAPGGPQRGGPQRGGPGDGRDGRDGREYRPVFSNMGGLRGGRGPDGPGGGRPNAAPNRGYGDRPPKQLFDVICAECGQPTQVPFLPRGTKPVYCRACFDKREGRS